MPCGYLPSRTAHCILTGTKTSL